MDVVVADTVAGGSETARLLLEGVPSTITLRDLIRLRVREEVARHNASRLAAGGSAAPRLDWEAQADAAVKAFRGNGYFVFVGDRQVEDLDEELRLADAEVVEFVRLTPLAGG